MFIGAIITVFFLLIIGSTFFYQFYWPKDPDVKAEPDNQKYFHESYDECRKAFREAVRGIAAENSELQVGSYLVDSKVDDDLTVDWCYLPPKRGNKKLLILTSGIHGIEGYTGSAIQLMFMEKFLMDHQLDGIGVMIIHGMNPYGFKYERKVTENNVDLNRNCVQEQYMFNGDNKGYGKLTDLLMPKGKTRIGSMKNRFFHLVAIRKILKESMPVLRQAALQGQYKFDKGIYFGGKKYDPQILYFKDLLQEKIAGFDTILNVDLHTAYGERGELHLFLNPIDNKNVENGIKTIFEGEEIDWGTSKHFYTINGEYASWISSLDDSKLCLPMLFEFGTMNSQTTFGSLKSIQIMINENQGVHYGYKNKHSKEKIERDFRKMYYPSSEIWRSKVIHDSHRLMSKMVQNFKEF